ncbi:MAG: hypothetical protein N3F09_03150 [Bacteroidia bacterium]|nr:hypothetical protein [Bacteroidia bacterium]
MKIICHFFFSFFLINFFANNVPTIDALIFKNGNVFLRISAIKSLNESKKLMEFKNNDHWEVSYQTSAEKPQVLFSINGKINSLKELEKWLFDQGFSNVIYLGKNILVSQIDENYMHPENPEVRTFEKRN